MSLLTGLVSYWKLDEGSGNAGDAHASNTLTLSNTTAPAAGILGTGRSISKVDGANGSLFSYESVFNPTGSFSFSIWLKPTSPSHDFWLIAKSNSSNAESPYMIDHYTTNGIRFVVRGSDTVVTATDEIGIVFDAWNFICVWYDGAQIGIEVRNSNGTTTKTAAHTSGISPNAFPITVGSINFNIWSAPVGTIDELGYWSKALDSTDRAALYNSGSGLAYENFASAADTTAPTVSTVTVNTAGTQTTVVFSEAVQGDGLGYSFDDATKLNYLSGDGTNTLVFTNERVIFSGETRTLSYSDTTGDTADTAANVLASFTGKAVTNNSTTVVDATAPTVSSATINASGNTLTVVFSEAVTGGAAGLTITPTGGAATLAYTSGSGTSTLVFSISRTIFSTETVTRSYDAGTGNIADAASNALASFTTQAVTNNSTEMADTTAPTVTGVSVTETSMTITFSESTSGSTGFAIAASGGAVTLSSPSGNGSPSRTFTLSRSIASTESLALTYSPGDVVDGSSNALAGFANRLATNNVHNTPSTGGISRSRLVNQYGG